MLSDKMRSVPFELNKQLRLLCFLTIAGFTPALFAQTTPAPVNFGSVLLGSRSATQTFSFSYPEATVTAFQAGAATYDHFTGIGECNAGLCSVPITFDPGLPGLIKNTVGYFSFGPPPPILGPSSTFSFSPLLTNFTGEVPVYGIGRGPEIASGPGAITTRVSRTLANTDIRAIASFIYQSGIGQLPLTFYISDPASNRVSLLPNGGSYGSANGLPGFAGDGGPAVETQFNNPTGLALDPLRNILIADTGNGRIRQISQPGSGQPTVSTIGGNGMLGGGGDGGLAVNASLNSPTYLAVGSTGNIYVSDTARSLVRVISAKTGIISRFAGTAGPGGYFGDGGAANTAILNHPLGLALDANDNLYIADAGNNVIRRVSGGTITTVAGQASVGGSFTGDGGPALNATLNAPSALAVDAGGSLYISDTGNNVIRKVSGDPSHIITTIVGSGTAGYSGDNGAATNAKLNAPGFLALDGTGVVTFVDGGNNVIRQVTATPAVVAFPHTVAGSTSTAEVTVSNIGNEPLHLTSISYSANFAGSQRGSCSTSSPLAAGQSCKLPISFVPSTGGETSGAVTVLSDNLNQNPAVIPFGPTRQTINVFSESKGLYFVPLAPCRVVDTRLAAGPFGAPFLSRGTSRDFSIRNSTSCPGAIPANADVQAYSLNVTVVPHGSLRWLSVYPANTTQPGVSTLNSYDGRTKANAAIIPASLADANRSITAYATDDTDVILDLNGYYVPASSNPTALAYFPIAPCRVADTRDSSFPTSLGSPALAAGQTRNFPLLSGTCGLPAEAQAYALNVTAVPVADPISYLTAWPSGQAQPGVSTLNATTGTVTANAAVVPAGSNGEISVYSTAATNLIIDVSGYYAPVTPGGLALYPFPPCRAYDSRTQPAPSGPRPPGPVSPLPPIVNLRGTCPVPAAAQAFVLNATLIPITPVSYLTLMGQPVPGSYESPGTQSTLNAYDGAVTSNLAVIPSANGVVEASYGSTTPLGPRADLLLDLFGYFAP